MSAKRKNLFKQNTMKKHIFRSIVFLSGLALLSSCLKNDPQNNATVYYGYQQIPNINDYMPQRLLNAFGPQHLYFGDEPPKIEGKFFADAFIYETNVKIDTLWQPRTGMLPVKAYFEFYDQHQGIAKYRELRPYKAQNGALLYLENGCNDSTYLIVNANDRFTKFVEDTIAPSYFKNGNPSAKDFQNIYIMGKDPYFTAYYYEVRDISSKTLPLLAVIISGKMSEETVVEIDTVNNTTTTITRPVIEDFRIGSQSMYYYNKETILYAPLITNGSLPLPGNAWILKSVGDLTYGEYTE